MKFSTKLAMTGAAVGLSFGTPGALIIDHASDLTETARAALRDSSAEVEQLEGQEMVAPAELVSAIERRDNAAAEVARTNELTDVGEVLLGGASSLALNALAGAVLAHRQERSLRQPLVTNPIQ